MNKIVFCFDIFKPLSEINTIEGLLFNSGIKLSKALICFDKHLLPGFICETQSENELSLIRALARINEQNVILYINENNVCVLQDLKNSVNSYAGVLKESSNVSKMHFFIDLSTSKVYTFT